MGRERAALQDPGEDLAARSVHAGRLMQLVPATSWRSAQALPAPAARHRPREHDPVAGVHRSHSVTDGLDDAGAFVPEQHRPRGAPVAVLDRPDIAVAHAARGEPDQHLAGPGVVDRDRFHADRGTCRLDHRAQTVRDHRVLLLAGRWPC
jgi:hypothetical protein